MEDAVILERTARLLLEREDKKARQELLTLATDDPVPAPIVDDRVAEERPPRGPKLSLKTAQRADVLRRDCWRCHYCGRKLVVAGVIEIIGTICPWEFPFPPGHAMPVARTHAAAVRVYPNIDHVHAVSLGGEWHEKANLIAACTPCNERKSDRLGWAHVEQERDDWDGLTALYRPLAQRLSEIRAYHQEWMRALGI